MTWLVLALLAAFMWGIGNVLVKKGLGHVSPLWNNILFNIFGLLLWLPFALLASHITINPLSFSVFFVILATFAAYYSFFYAIDKGEISLTGTIVATYPVTTVLLSNIFLGERITSMQLVGIFSVILGSLLIALPEKKLPSVIRNYSWLRWGMITSLIIGLADFLAKYSINQVS